MVKKNKKEKSKRGNTSSAVTAKQAAAMCLVFACQIEPRNKRYRKSLSLAMRSASRTKRGRVREGEQE